MTFFNLFRRPDINSGAETFRATPGAVLLDVRTPEEFASGHLPASRNADLRTISSSPALPRDRNVPLFLYCRSGSRSGQAAVLLRQMGYTQVTDIGGILSYRGPLEY